jgi:hypothetical protein
MKCGSQMAVALVGGYLLGRSQKFRLAALLALLAAGGKLPIDQKELLSKLPLGASLDKLTGDLRGQLVDAGLSVAKKAASSRMDSLSDKLQQRAETMRGQGVAEGEEREEPEDIEEEPARPPRERRETARRGRGREQEREEPARRERTREPERDELEDEEYEDEEYEDDEYEGDDDKGEEPERDSREERRAAARRTRREPSRAPRREEDRPRRDRVTR